MPASPSRVKRSRRGRIATFVVGVLAALLVPAAASLAACGDGVLEPGESCDDGNLVAGDGCDARCRFEGRLHWMRGPLYYRTVGDFPGFRGNEHVVAAGAAVTAIGIFDTHFYIADVFDPLTGASLPTIPYPYTGPIAPLGDRLLLVDQDSVPPVIRVIDPTTGATDTTLVDPTPGNFGFARTLLGIGDTVFARDGTTGSVLAYDASGPLRYTISAPRDAAGFGHTIIPLGADVLIAGTSAVDRYDVATGTRRESYFDATPGVGAFGTEMVVAGGDVLVAGDGTGAVQRFDAATGTPGPTIHPPLGPDAAFGRRLALTGHDLVVGATDAVHVFDATTGTFERTLRNPEPQTRGCFGSEVRATANGIVVASDECLDWSGETDCGVIYFFDVESGALIDTLPNPSCDDDDRFRAVFASDAVVIGRSEKVDDGTLAGYRPCIDGVLAPGEECDDGNLVNGDGCDVSCRVTRCGNGTVTAGEECDDGNQISGDGCEPDCTWSPLACRYFSLDDARILVRGGEGDRTVIVTGTLPPFTVQRVQRAGEPATSGAELLVTDATNAALLDASLATAPIPPGPRGTGCGPGDGWRVRGGRSTYVNRSNALPPACTPGSAGGLARFELREGPDAVATMRFVVRGVTGPAPTVPIHAFVQLGNREHGACWSFTPDVGTCTTSPNGRKLICR